jgi:nicotinamide mononucleotide (NMN) deamidase PncC
VTGFLGPSKPGEQVGLTYIALCTPDDRVLLRQYSEDHGPGRNRERDVRMALRLVVEAISAEG